MFIYKKYNWLNRKEATPLTNFYRDDELMSDIGRYQLEKENNKYFVSNCFGGTYKIERTKQEIEKEFETVKGEKLYLNF